MTVALFVRPVVSFKRFLYRISNQGSRAADPLRRCSPYSRHNICNKLVGKSTRYFCSVSSGESELQHASHKPSLRTKGSSVDNGFMQLALAEAKKAFDAGEVPVGAVLVDKDGKIVGTGRNRVELLSDPTQHAEMEALRTGPEGYGWRRLGCTLYTTLEPCAMCCSAAALARVRRIVYGAPDLRLGACGTWIDLPAYNHPFHTFDEIVSGVCAEEASDLMRQFFRERRRRPKDCVPFTTHETEAPP